MKWFISLFLLVHGLANAQTPNDLAAMLFIEQANREMPKDSALCLEVDHADVPSSLLTALRQKDQRFVPASSCARVFDVSKGSYHKETGKPGFFISVSNFRMVGKNEAEIQLDIFHHSKWGDFKTLLVQETKKGWRVIKIVRHLAA